MTIAGRLQLSYVKTGIARLMNPLNTNTTNPQNIQQPSPPMGPVVSPKDASSANRTNPNSTQNTLQINEIRDGIVIMNDGSFRAVVMVKSINFDLM